MKTKNFAYKLCIILEQKSNEIGYASVELKEAFDFFSILVFDKELEGRRVLEFLHDWSMCVGLMVRRRLTWVCKSVCAI